MIDKFFHKAEAWINRLNIQGTVTKPDCEDTIICECGKRNCLGTTLAISTYVRKIKAIE